MAPQKRRHNWTDFEKHALLCLMCRGIHITGFPDAKEEVEFGRSFSKKMKKQEPVKIDSKKAYMDVSTALNDTVHNRDFQGDIPYKEVVAMIDEILTSKKGAMFVIERQRVSRVTRSMKRVFERGIGFIGDQREWRAGRKEREKKLRLERMSNTVRKSNDDTMDVNAAQTSPDVSAVADCGWGAFGAENAAIVAQTQSTDSNEDDWGCDATEVAAPMAQVALGDEWGGSGETALVTTSALARIQGVSDEWGGFGNESTETTSTQTQTQTQVIEDEWSSSTGATLSISPALMTNKTSGNGWTESGGVSSIEERALFGNRAIVDDLGVSRIATSNKSPDLGRYQTVIDFGVGLGDTSSASDQDLVEMQSRDWDGSTGATSTITPAFVTSQTGTDASGGTGSSIYTTPTPTMSQTMSEDWGGIESRTTKIVSGPGKGVGDWSGLGSTSLTARISTTIQNQAVDANMDEFRRGTTTATAADTTSTQISNNSTGVTNINAAAKVLSSMENLWGSVGSQVGETFSKTAVDGMGSGPLSTLTTAATVIEQNNDVLNLWDQPLPSTEKLTPKLVPSVSRDSWGAPPSSLINNRSSSGTFSQSDNDEGWSGDSTRSISFTFQRNVRSMAPSPDIPGRDGLPEVLSQDSTVLTSTDIMEVDDDWEGAKTEKHVASNDDGGWLSSMRVKPRGIKTLGQVASSTPTQGASGESLASIIHPSVRQPSSSEEGSNLVSWPTTGPPTPTESIVTCSPLIANAGINPERLAMLATYNQDADVEIPDSGAELEKQKNKRRGKSDKNSNYVDLPFNRSENIHRKRD